jgi:hypothetical protein
MAAVAKSWQRFRCVPLVICDRLDRWNSWNQLRGRHVVAAVEATLPRGQVAHFSWFEPQSIHHEKFPECGVMP